MFDAVKRALKGFTGAAKEAATDVAKDAKPAPAAAAKPAPRVEPRVEVVRPTPDTKAGAAERFNQEISRAASDPPGTPPEHALQGGEFEEGDRTAVPAPKPHAAPGVPERLRNVPEPASKIGKPPQAALEAPKSPASASPPPKPTGKGIDPAKVQDLLWDLELALLESDVALPVVEALKERLEKRLPEIRVAKADDIPGAVEGALKEALRSLLDLRIDFDGWLLDKLAEKKPVVIMFVGVNGTGKTTSIGRLAYRLREDGVTSVLAAGDTFRAGAIEQLTRHGDNLGIPVIKTQAGGDPAAVAYDAIEHAKARRKDVVLLDTAGRMQTNTNLMDEMKKIKRVAQPDMIVFVGDSLAGNDAVEQAVQFDAAVGIDAAILTKVDTDAKGGAALSIAHAVGKPLLFLGVGQEYKDFIPYDPDWMVQRIFE